MAAIRFAQRLINWHRRHGRHDLPWQADPDPYRVWVSEIMLQQTQVATVIPYYQRFMARFPTVTALADAHEDEVLAHWAGLGYYARARNLHRAARLVRDIHGGRFPTTLEAVMDLPGIGRSTAGAILSLACGQRHPILDGNVKRVLARYHAVEGWPGQRQVLDRLWRLAEQHTPRKRVAVYTQAIMDLGATVCTRGSPACGACPVAPGCQAHAQGRTGELPAPRPRRALPERETCLLVLERANGDVLLEKRPPAGIWGGLWSLPECDHPDQAGRLARERYGLRATAAEPLPELRHSFTHFHLRIRPLRLRVEEPHDLCLDSPACLWYNCASPSRHGLAAPVRRLLESNCRRTR